MSPRQHSLKIYFSRSAEASTIKALPREKPSSDNPAGSSLHGIIVTDNYELFSRKAAIESYKSSFA